MERIPFYDTELLVERDEQGNGWVAVKPICDAIGLNNKGQQEKLSLDPKFSCVDIHMTGADGKTYEMFCVPVSQLNGWLYTINVNKVSPKAQRKLLVYQQECQDVLFRYFMPQGGTNAELVDMIGSLRHDMEEGFASIRGEVDELRALVHIVMSDKDEAEIRSLIREIKNNLGMDGRAIIGFRWS